MPVINCKICGREKFHKPYRIKNGWGKYCSIICYGKSRLGRECSDDEKEKYRIAMLGKFVGEKSPLWKGDRISYKGLHRWVSDRKGKPHICEHCGTQNLTRQRIHWANKSGLYFRNLEDWIRLCSSCHQKYDFILNNV